MHRNHVLVAASLALLLTACGKKDSSPATSPYPGLTVTGTVLDVRGSVPVAGAQVLVWNGFDTGSATSAVNGTFTITVDGSDGTSWLRVSQAGYRPYQTTVSVTPTHTALGGFAVVSKDEVLMATTSGDIHMIRVGGDGTLLPVATGNTVEQSPARSESGLTVRWVDATAGTVREAAWNGSGAHDVWTATAGNALLSMAWSPRATFVWTNNGSADAIAMAGEPSGVGSNFHYNWPGVQPDASPDAFGNFGPQPIEGNMLAFAGGNGIYTAFPYFTDTFLVPEKISSIPAGSLRPRWSPYRTDGTLDLAYLDSSNDVWVTRVSVSNHQNVWSTPQRIYGGTTGQVRISDLGWAPETVGAVDRLALVVHPLSAGGTDFGSGDVVVLGWDHVTKAVTGPTLLYSAAGVGNVGKTWGAAWR